MGFTNSLREIRREKVLPTEPNPWIISQLLTINYFFIMLKEGRKGLVAFRLFHFRFIGRNHHEL